MCVIFDVIIKELDAIKADDFKNDCDKKQKRDHKGYYEISIRDAIEVGSKYIHIINPYQQTITKYFKTTMGALEDYEKDFGRSRELSLVKTKLEEAELWFSKVE